MLLVSTCFVVVVLVARTEGNGHQLVTFNAGLQPDGSIAAWKERKEALKSAINASSADVICLQEVIRQQDILDVVGAVQSQYPYWHSRSSIGMPGQMVPKAAACDAGKLDQLLACINSSCNPGCSFSSGATCSLTKCMAEVNGVGQDCFNCFDRLDFKGVDQCNSSERDNFVKSQCAAAIDSHVTTHGLLLLSKLELTNKGYYDYYRDVVRVTRGYLSAEVSGLGTIVCTHLDYRSVQDYELVQLLRNFPSGLLTNGCPPVLMGDFNHGPARPDKGVPDDTLGDKYNIVINAGYTSPYADDVGLCTICPTNGIRKAKGSRGIEVIDHVYVVGNARGVTATNAQRYWDRENVTSVGPLSDHYGSSINYQCMPGSLSTVPCTGNSAYSLVTFNAGLQPDLSVAGYSERLEKLKTEIKASTADVICLQEIIRQQDLLDVIDAVRTEYPYWHARADTVGLPGKMAPHAAACGSWNLEQVFSCVLANCSTELAKSFSKALDCDKCSAVVDRLRQECFNCFDWKVFAASLDNSNSTAVFEFVRNNCGRDTDAYTTTHGLLLLSKSELVNKGFYDYDVPGVVRVPKGYISAEISGLGPICCTHLDYRSAIQPPQLTKMLANFPSNIDGCPPVLLGDFNHGPDVIRNGTIVVPEENGLFYDRVVAARYRSPYVSEVGECTICPTNGIRAAKGSGAVELIDHIYVGAADQQIVVTDVQRYWDSNNLTSVGPLSDHFGVFLTYQRSPSVTPSPTSSSSPSSSPSSVYSHFKEWLLFSLASVVVVQVLLA